MLFSAVHCFTTFSRHVTLRLRGGRHEFLAVRFLLCGSIVSPPSRKKLLVQFCLVSSTSKVEAQVFGFPERSSSESICACCRGADKLLVQDHTLQDTVSQWFFGTWRSIKIDLLCIAGEHRYITNLEHMKMNFARVSTKA